VTDDDAPAQERPGLQAVRRAARCSSALFGVFLVFGGSHRAPDAVAATRVTAIPHVPPAPSMDGWLDRTPTSITVSLGWQRLRVAVPAWRLRSDPTLWLWMRLEDWNGAPPLLRHAGLTEMFSRYAHVLQGPTAWEPMTALDWDEIPHPVRVVAAWRMVRRRVAETAPGGAFGIAAPEIAETLSAILMVESWFEHRAVNVNPRGDRDLGLAQASEFCRSRLEELYERGCIQQAFTEQDYFDPWRATEIATIWFLLMLDEAEGDLGLAVRAYHRGIAAARAGAGEAYFEQVEKRTQWFRETKSRSWRIAMERSREIEPGPGDLPASGLAPLDHAQTRYHVASPDAETAGRQCRSAGGRPCSACRLTSRKAARTATTSGTSARSARITRGELQR
jgi:hypothetical protein